MYAFAKVLFAIIVAFLLIMVVSEYYHNEEFVPFEEVEKMIELNEMAHDALKTATEREKKGQLLSDTISVLKHCAGEVVEATYAFNELCCFGDDMPDTAMYKTAFADELADVITCALIAAANEDIDIEFALKRVQKKNEGRVVEVEK